MTSLLSSGTLNPNPLLNFNSTQSMLEHALTFARQNNLQQAALAFSLAANELSNLYPELETLFKTLVQNVENYRQTQQLLGDAAKKLTELQIQQQNQVRELADALSFATLPAQVAKHTADAPPLRISSCLENLPPLYATCFGRFELWREGHPVNLCNNRNGQAVLRYLVMQPEHCEAMPILMNLLWPEDDDETARRKLRVAVSALRRSLNQGFDCPSGEGYILCRNEYYQLNPTVSVQTDVQRFLQCYQAGQQPQPKQAMAQQYEAACRLYNGSFLLDDLYADWSFMQRQQLSQYFVAMCRILNDFYLENANYERALNWSTRVVSENRCDELAHRQLMRAYALSGQRSSALKQYQYCRQILQEELGVEPLPETEQLFFAISNNELGDLRIAVEPK
jgi:DNA-binding SARP family transcriptional activator